MCKLKINLKNFFFYFILGLFIGLFIAFSYFSINNEDSQILIEICKENPLLQKIKNSLVNVKGKNGCDYQENGPRILCVILTHKKNFETKAKAVNQTWGKRCDKTIFVSGKSIQKENFFNTSLNLVYLNYTETNDKYKLTNKTIQTILYINENLINEFDWVLKADDDTYVIVENLKEFLKNKCQDDNFYGFTYLPHSQEVNWEFNSGGAGYLISNKVIQKFSNTYKNNSTFCRKTTGYEDADLAKCLSQIHVTPGDSRDDLHRERFHPYQINYMWNVPVNSWEELNSKYPIKKNEESSSDSSISFHHMSEKDIFIMDFLLYKLKSKIK